MKQILLAAVLLVVYGTATAQSTEKLYPKTLWSPNDSFGVQFHRPTIKAHGDLHKMRVSEEDTADMGTDGMPGLYATIHYGKDSLIIKYTNTPYEQILYIPVHSPKGKTLYRLHFNSIVSYFSPAYVKAHDGQVSVEIPEVYELANIIWTLSPAGQKATDLDKEGAYYEKVTAWFKPYLQHPVFKQLAFADSVYYDKYYDFRENSFCFHFANDKDTKLLYDGPYYYVMGDDWDNYNSLFKQLRPLVEDFAKKSKFREFYKANKDYYAAQIARQEELMPVKAMWQWLEQKAPGRKFNSYKVVFSPLIGGSHSTQNYTSFLGDGWYQEAVMFVCGPYSREERKDLSEQQKEGLMTGIVFTEIDHNYVNPVSYKYEAALDSIFSNREFWANKRTAMYGSPMSVFNEYMTHSLYCLYLTDTYDKPTADYLIEQREAMMADRRGFINFRAFNKELLVQYSRNKNTTLQELYPGIIGWCREQR